MVKEAITTGNYVMGQEEKLLEVYKTLTSRLGGRIARRGMAGGTVQLTSRGQVSDTSNRMIRRLEGHDPLSSMAQILPYSILPKKPPTVPSVARDMPLLVEQWA